MQVSCGADERAIPEIPRDLSTSKTQQGVRLDLAALELRTHEDFDRFEERVLSKMPAARAIEVYEALADTRRVGEPRADALLLSRRFVFMFRSTGQTSDEAERKSLIERAQSIRSELRKNYPKDPHTLFTEGYFSLQIYQVYGMQARSRANKILGEDIRTQSANELKSAWGELLKIAPDYEGCDGFDATRIRQELDRIEEAPVEVKVDRRSEGSTQPVASDNLALARESLWALENKPQQRASTCRDYQKAMTTREGLSLPASFAEADIAFQCGVSLGNRDLAILGLGQLILRGPRTDVCSDLEALRCRNQSRACSVLKETINAMSAGSMQSKREDLCIAASILAAQTLVVARSLKIGTVPTQESDESEPKEIDVVENGQRLRRLEKLSGVILGQAIGVRDGDVDGFPRTKRTQRAINEAMMTPETRALWGKIAGLLLGKEEAVATSFEKAEFDGISGYLLQLQKLPTQLPKRTLDVSFLFTGATTEATWHVSAISVFANLDEREKLLAWSTPKFPPALPKKTEVIEDSAADNKVDEKGREAEPKVEPEVKKGDKKPSDAKKAVPPSGEPKAQ